MPGFEWRQVRADNTDVSPYMRLAYDINRDAARAWVDTGRALNEMYTNYKNQQFLRGMASARDPNDPQSINNFLRNAAQGEQYIGMSNDTLQNALNNQGNVYNQLRREQLDIQRDDIADAQTKAYLAYYNGDAEGLRQAQREGTDLVNSKNYRSDAFIYNNPYDIEKNQSQLATEAAHRGLMGAQADQARAAAGKTWNEITTDQGTYWLLNRFNQRKLPLKPDDGTEETRKYNEYVMQRNADLLQSTIQEAPQHGVNLTSKSINNFLNEARASENGPLVIDNYAYGSRYTNGGVNKEAAPNPNEAGYGGTTVEKRSGSVWGSASVSQHPSSGSNRGNGGEGQSNANVSSGEVNSGIGSKLAGESTVQTESNGEVQPSQKEKANTAQQAESVLNGAIASVNNSAPQVPGVEPGQRTQASSAVKGSSFGSGTPTVTTGSESPANTNASSSGSNPIAVPPIVNPNTGEVIAPAVNNAERASEVLSSASTNSQKPAPANTSQQPATASTPAAQTPSSTTVSNPLNNAIDAKTIAEGLKGMPADVIQKSIVELGNQRGAEFATQVMEEIYRPAGSARVNNINSNLPYISSQMQGNIDAAADLTDAAYNSFIRSGGQIDPLVFGQAVQSVNEVKNRANTELSQMIVGSESPISGVDLVKLASNKSRTNLVEVANTLGLTDSKGNAITSENVGQIANASVDTLVNKIASTLKTGVNEDLEISDSDIRDMKITARRIARQFDGNANSNLIGAMCVFTGVFARNSLIDNDYEFSEQTAMNTATNLQNIYNPNTAQGRAFLELNNINNTFKNFTESYTELQQARSLLNKANTGILENSNLTNSNPGYRTIRDMSKAAVSDAEVKVINSLLDVVSNTEDVSSNERRARLNN